MDGNMGRRRGEQREVRTDDEALQRGEVLAQGAEEKTNIEGKP